MKVWFTLPFLALLVAACAPATSAAPPANRPTCPDTIVIQDFAFSPPSCQVVLGTTLTFINQDSAPHTATSTEGARAVFNTGTLAQDASATVTFNAPGTYPFHCAIHPAMTGNIMVTGEDMTPTGDGMTAGDGY